MKVKGIERLLQTKELLVKVFEEFCPFIAVHDVVHISTPDGWGD